MQGNDRNPAIPVRYVCFPTNGNAHNKQLNQFRNRIYLWHKGKEPDAGDV